MKIPIIITTALTIITVIAVGYLYWDTSLCLLNAELIGLQITIIGTYGALVSASFVVYSYIHTNNAFIESRRPQLLIQVVTQMNPDNMTYIHYSNITTNRFSDLSIFLRVVAQNREFRLNDMFNSKMIMEGYDKRHRSFRTLSELIGRGIDINEVARAGNEVKLIVSYSYTYYGTLSEIECQDYKWNARTQTWDIS